MTVTGELLTKTASNGTVYRTNGVKATRKLIFLHGNLDKPDVDDILAQSPFTYIYDKTKPVSQMLLCDTADHNLEIICPIYPNVAQRYNRDFIPSLLADPGINDGSSLILAGNSIGGEAVISEYAFGNYRFAAYISFSPYLKNFTTFVAADFVNSKEPISFIHAVNDDVSSQKQTVSVASAIRSNGKSVSEYYPLGGGHFASSNMFSKPAESKKYVYDWIDEKVLPVIIDPPVRVNMRSVYKEGDKKYILWEDGSVSEI